MDDEKYVPGVWRCEKCNFRLMQSNLNASSGTVTPRDTPGDKCPNCNKALWRVTWKEEALENLSIAENQMRRAIEAEARLAAKASEAAVKVIPLEWTDHPAGGLQAFAGGLRMWLHPDGDEWHMELDHHGRGGKTAAQAHFERCILSAIATT